MGELPDALSDTLEQASAVYFARAIPEGRYVAWVAYARARPSKVIGGAGVQLRELLPRPHPAHSRLMRGPQGLVLNVFTERAWRRRGVAEALMRELLGWCRDHGVESVVLHASKEGRPLYEKLGFTATNEMRYDGGVTP